MTHHTHTCENHHAWSRSPVRWQALIYVTTALTALALYQLADVDLAIALVLGFLGACVIAAAALAVSHRGGREQ